MNMKLRSGLADGLQTQKDGIGSKSFSSETSTVNTDHVFLL